MILYEWCPAGGVGGGWRGSKDFGGASVRTDLHFRGYNISNVGLGRKKERKVGIKLNSAPAEIEHRTSGAFGSKRMSLVVVMIN